jgi:RNA polymerase sigma-54 factor
MRMDQRQLLTPRMIQSMEILQLPLAALEERIEQELQNNPVLELREPGDNGAEGETMAEAPPVDDAPEPREEFSDGEQALVVKDKENSDAAEFERLEKISEYLENEEFSSGARLNYRAAASYDGERDKKLDALNNTAARAGNLTEHLLDQWLFVEAPEGVKRAGEAIISAITPEGYLHTELEAIQQESTKVPLTMEDLRTALALVQKLEPAGIGARSLQECLLLQLEQLEEDGEDEGHDLELERKLVSDHLKDLEMNRYPLISKKLDRPIDELKSAVKRLGRLHPHPGKQIGADEAPPITPDAIIYLDEETGKYEIEMTNDPAPSLYISGTYRKMLKNRAMDKNGHKPIDKQTREFLSNNVRNARWLIESIEQRRSTILRVIRQVVDAQKEFFDKGPEFLKPLPMIEVADRLGIHVATVSRAVSEKWIQTPRGVFPLRRFFSGGTTNAEGEDMSWDAVKEKLRVIIDNEDKHNPLNDDEIVVKLADQGLTLARRTVAKYRKILNIPTARQRREF